MRVITAPNHPTVNEYDAFWPTLFVSGGITGAPNWQPGYLDMLRDVYGLAFNPRRPEFDVRDPNGATEQIAWEAKYLAFSNAISFWFPCETLCPITLYELGTWTPTHVLCSDLESGQPVVQTKTLFIGIHPDYKRREDVEVQTKLRRKDIEIVYSIGALAEQVRKWVNAGPGGW